MRCVYVYVCVFVFVCVCLCLCVWCVFVSAYAWGKRDGLCLCIVKSVYM